MDKLSKPLKNIANVLGRKEKERRLEKTEDAISAYPHETRKFEKGTSIMLCPKIESEGTSVDVFPAKVGSDDTGNYFENFGHSQMNGSKNEDTLLFGVDRSDDVTLPNVTADVQGLTVQDIAQSIETVYKVKEEAPSPSNNAKFEEDSSLGKTVNDSICMTASVKTKKDGDKNTVNCDSEIVKINNSVSPTSLSVQELDHITMSASQEVSRKYSLNNCVSDQEPLPEQLRVDSSLQPSCKMEAGFCEIVSMRGGEEHINEKKPMNGCVTILTSGADEIPNILDDSNGPITDKCGFVPSNLDTKVESIIMLAEIDDDCSNSRTAGINLKPQQISGDSPTDKNARKNDIVSCPSLLSDVGNKLSAGYCPDQKREECDRKAEIITEFLVESEAGVTSLKTQFELSDEQNFRTKTQQVNDSPHKKNARTYSNLLCPSMVMDIGNKLSDVKCPDQKTGECNRKEEIKNDILAGGEVEVTSLKTPCELFDEQNFNTSEKKDVVLSSKTDSSEDINQIKFTEFRALALENVKNHDTILNEAKNNEKFKLLLPESDEPSPNLVWEWKRQLKSSTPCQKFSQIICEDDAPNASQILSTPKVKRNVNLDTTKGKKIDFTEIVEDKIKDCFVENSEKLRVNRMEKNAAYNKTENVKIVPNIKQEQENPLKLSETCSDNKSKQMKRPASPEPLGRKRADGSDLTKKKIIEIDLTIDETENETQRKKSYEKNFKQPTNFVSQNPEENDDNNNPEWEVLKKLETDDERYKAVRKRWRNLVIPDPNKNLTCIHMRSTFKHPNLCKHGGENEGNENARVRKRTHSHEPSTSTDHVPVKRARTRSCITSYEMKVQDCYKKMEEEARKLSEEKKHALANTSNYFYGQYSSLLASNLRFYDNRAFQTRIEALSAAEKRAEEAVHQDYFGAIDRLENEKRRQALVFKNAMKEVETFHKFYRKLDDSSKKDCFFLTDVELDDVKATDELYEKMNTFYS